MQLQLFFIQDNILDLIDLRWIEISIVEKQNKTQIQNKAKQTARNEL